MLTIKAISRQLMKIQKYNLGELKRVLGYIGNASDNHSFGASYRLSPPAATEELRHYKSGVLDGLKNARERSEMFGDSIVKLDKYKEFVGSKKRQRPDFFSNERLSGSNLLKMTQISRIIHDQSAQKLENKSKSMVLNNNKRSRLPADLKVCVLPFSNGNFPRRVCFARRTLNLHSNELSEAKLHFKIFAQNI